ARLNIGRNGGLLLVHTLESRGSLRPQIDYLRLLRADGRDQHKQTECPDHTGVSFLRADSATYLRSVIVTGERSENRNCDSPPILAGSPRVARTTAVPAPPPTPAPIAAPAPPPAIAPISAPAPAPI